MNSVILDSSFPHQPRIALCGPSNCGKDTAALYIARHTPLRFRGSLSWYLAPYVGRELGVSAEEAFAHRHERMRLWHEVGDRVRREDPLALVRDCLAESDVVAGSRSRVEMEAARGLLDLVIWVDRPVPDDPTLEYGEDLADVVVPNYGAVAEFHARLFRLFANFAGIDWQGETQEKREDACIRAL